MRSISRVVGININTVTKLLVGAGEACIAYHDEAVRNVRARHIQCDEIWSFCYAKQKNADRAKGVVDMAGDVWTWTGIDSDTKLVVSWLVGGRDSGYALEFMDDLRDRLANRGTAIHRRPQSLSGGRRRRLWCGCRLRPANQAVRFSDRRRGAAALLPRTVYRGSQGSSVRSPRYGRAEYFLCRTPQPHDADVHEALHPSDQRLL